MKPAEIINIVKAEIRAKLGVEVLISAVSPAVTGCRILLIYKRRQKNCYFVDMKLIAEGFNESLINTVAELEEKIEDLLPTNYEENEQDRIERIGNLVYFITSNEDPADTGKPENTERFERKYKLTIKTQ